MSEAHQRQLLIVAENPHQFIDTYSNDFFKTFVSLWKRRYNTKRVLANNVYQEYIADKDHLHMNATKWTTLSEFVKHLGREGLAIVDETPKGWYIQYIDRDPEELERQRKIEKMDAAMRDDEERQSKNMFSF